jgi:hypothetical protein
MTDYVFGGGLSGGTSTINSSTVVNKKGETLNDIFWKIVFENVLTGGFCNELILNEKNQLSEIYNHHLKNIRTDKSEKNIYYSEDWSEYRVKFLKNKK